jgi:hypothetical protein
VVVVQLLQEVKPMEKVAAVVVVEVEEEEKEEVILVKILT